MNKYFSLLTGGFYIEELRAAYDDAGTWPADAVAVTPADEAMLREAISAGATIRNKSGGKWSITARPALSFAVSAAPYLATVRQVRDAILNRLAGIGLAAMASGDADTVQAITAARTCLLDITTCPSVVAAQDMDALQEAVGAEYARIAATLPDEARRAFDDAGMTHPATQ